jgi:hypothetical protein
MTDILNVESKPAVRRDLPPGLLGHLKFGWGALLIFLTLGVVLEGLHGFKAGYYLDVSNHTRRLMWTLAHAHGTVLGLVQIAFAVSLPYLVWGERERTFVSACLIGAGLLIPIGFFLGGLVIHSGDPGLGILLVPVGALLLLLGVGLTLRAFYKGRAAALPPRGAGASSPAVRPTNRN